MTRNIDEYWDTYEENYGFEEVLSVYRERKALNFLYKRQAKNILEIGGGFKPLFLKYKEFHQYTVVEPGKRAFEFISKFAEPNSRIECIYGSLENTFEKLLQYNFDFIVLNGVLHEIEKPEIFLNILSKLMKDETLVYIEVPNAKSFHRVLAKKMGLIQSVFDKTSLNLKLQQQIVFDSSSLVKLLMQAMPNIRVKKLGTFFIKPFTNEQMFLAAKNGILNQDIFEGLFLLSEVFPDDGCELFCVIQKEQ